jgi:hypothetical protein
MAVEEHGSGKQFARYRVWPRFSLGEFLLAALFGALSYGAAVDRAWGVTGIFCALAVLMLSRSFYECGSAVATVLRALQPMERSAATHVGLETRPAFAGEDPQPGTEAVIEKTSIQMSEMGNFQR